MMSRQTYRRLCRERESLQKKVENKATAALHDKRLPLWIRKVKLNQLHKKGLLMNIESVNN